MGHKSWEHHCSPSHTKMAASGWPGGGETAAADENKFCSTVQNKSWHRPGGMAERVEDSTWSINQPMEFTYILNIID